MILKTIRMKKEDGDLLKKSVEKTAQVLLDMGVPPSESKPSGRGGWVGRLESQWNKVGK